MPTEGRRERKLKRTRDTIAIAALALFESRGFEQTSMEEIAEAADVAKGTLYNHFPSKEAVLAQSIHVQLASDLEGLGDLFRAYPSFRARLSALLTTSAAWCEAHRAYLPHYLRHEILSASAGRELANVAQKELVGAYAALIEAAQSAGEIRADLAALRLATDLHYLYLAGLFRWLAVDGLDLREEFATMVDLFINGASQDAVDRSRRRAGYSDDGSQAPARRPPRRVKPRSAR